MSSRVVETTDEASGAVSCCAGLVLRLRAQGRRAKHALAGHDAESFCYRELLLHVTGFGSAVQVSACMVS